MTTGRNGKNVSERQDEAGARLDWEGGRAPRGGREARQEATRRLIARAASDLLAERALDAMTMDDVAQAANVSKATLYKHYASKEALFEAVVEEFCARMQALPILAPPREAEPEIYLRRTVAAFAEVMLSQEAITLTKRCIEAGQAGRPGAGSLLWSSFYERLHGKASEHLHELQVRGTIRSGSADDLARRFLAMIVSPLLLSTMLECRTAPDPSDVLAAAESAVRLVLFGVRSQSMPEGVSTL